ncbi:MAG: AAA family ATPase [Lactobacillus sp.]|jgi:uncharacterized protein YhaN|nr:AAA family ATPase [Lactobacillus sp.]
MYIRHVKIFGFGNLIEREFTFDPNLTVVYGLNETGKSTLLEFIVSILFGFATKKRPFEQYIPKNSGRYGGELTLNIKGEDYLVRRVDGTSGGELETYINQQKVPNALFYNALKPLNKDLFKELFYFDTNEMLSIANLNKSELMQQILAIGAINSGDWLKQAETFEGQAKDLYKPSGRKPPINQKLSDYHALEQKIQRTRQNLPRYLALENDQADVSQKLTDIVAQQSHLDADVKQLAHLQAIWPSYQQYLDLQDEQKPYMANDRDVVAVNEKYQQMQTKIDMRTDFIEKRRGQSLQPATGNTYYDTHADEFLQIQQKLPHIQTLASRHEVLQKRITENKNQLAQLQQSNAAVTSDMQPLSSEDLSLVSQYKAQAKTQATLKAQLDQTDAELQLQENQQVRALNDLQAAQDQGSPAENNGFLNGLMVLGGLIFIVGLFLPSFVKIISLAGVGLVALSIYQKKTVATRTTDPQIDGQIQVVQAQIESIKQQRHQLGAKQQEVSQKLQELTQNIQQIQQKYHLNDQVDPLQVQSLLTTIDQLQEDIQNQTAELEDMQQQLIEFDNLAAFLKDKLGQLATFSKDYFQVLNDALKDFEQVSAQNQQTILEQEQLKTWLKQQNVELADLRYQQQQLLADNHFKDFTELQKALEALKTVRDNQERFHFLKNQLAPELENLTHFQSEADLKQTLEQQRKQLVALNEQTEKLHQTHNELTVKTTQLATGDRLQELQQQLANLQTSLLGDINDYLIATLTAQWVRGTLEAASQNRLPKILEHAQAYFKILTFDKYQKIIFKAQNIYVQSQDVQEFNVNELSLGTMEQLYLALRLAFTVELSDLVKMPILLDDVLVNADQQRLTQLVKLVERISGDNQIILTTAHNEFLDLFKAAKVIQL